MSLASLVLRLLPFGFAAVAVAGLVHIGTVLAYPGGTRDDAFARVAALATVNTKVALPTADASRLPSRDPAMASAVCRYDLARGPFHVGVDALDDGFLSLGLHSRRGMPFYGLNLRAGEGGQIDIVLMTEQQKAEADAAGEEPARRELRVVASEAQGFVTIDTPVEGRDGGRAALDHVTCGARTSDATGTRPG